MKLTTRVAAIALVAGVGGLFVAFMLLGSLAQAPSELKAVLLIVMLLFLPLLIGWLTARLIGKPLKELDDAIAALRANNKAKILTPEIAEFGYVYASFNELAKRLHQEEELRKNLISDASHELNTPLTALSTQLTAMQEGKLPITKRRITGLKEQVDRLGQLIAGLDAYTKARLPKTESPEDIPLRQYLQELIDELVPEVDSRNVQVELTVASDLTIQGSPAALRQVLLNLLHNSLRYAEASRIAITADAHTLTVSDNGKGVPLDSLPHLFERFYRVDPSRNRATGGLGLGLAIVKELVERQGWHIRAESAEPGLAFIITFNK